MKRYEFVSPVGSGGRIREDAEGMWVSVIDARHAISARDARIAELERQIEIRNAECRAWRALDDTLRSESFTTLNDRRGDVDAARAATDAAGGVG